MTNYMKTVTLWTCKSERKNSKSDSMDKQIFTVGWNGKGATPRTQFALDDICDMLDFACRSKYRNLKITVYDQFGISIYFSMANRIYSIEQVINTLYFYMQALNQNEWEMTISELHQNPRIRYYINEYYHGNNTQKDSI